MRAVSLAGALVGPDSELATLARLVKKTAAGQAVLVEGEPGIGKSALVREVLAEAADVGCQVFWGVGDELSQTLPALAVDRGLGGTRGLGQTPAEHGPGLLRGEVAADRGIDVSAALAEQCPLMPSLT